jgi:lactate dehydrogenase-like 2-hydroxyacid dehydrogenase
MAKGCIDETLDLPPRLPESVMADAEARFDVTCRSVTTPMDHDECVAALAEYDVVLPTLGDAFKADAFAAVPEPRCKLLANFGVGYNHIDVAAAARLRVWR